MDKKFDVKNHVRYVVALTRVLSDKKRYTPMKINIEAAEASDEAVVRDKLARAFRREMHDDLKREALAEQAGTLTWRWLEGLRSGHHTLLLREQDMLLVPQGCYCGDDSDHLEVAIFTKEDQAEVEKLLAKL